MIVIDSPSLSMSKTPARPFLSYGINGPALERAASRYVARICLTLIQDGTPH